MFTDSYGNVRFPGLYRGIVKDSKDPLGRGRVRLQVPQVLGDAVTDWAWGSYKAGLQTTDLTVGTGVWVQFEGGDPAFPVWTDGFSSDGSVDYLQINTAYEGGSQEVGQLTWNTEDETPEVKVGNGEVTLQIGQEFHARVSNTSGTTILPGVVVYYNGDVGSNGHASVRPYLADGTISAFKVVGITTQEIPPGGDGLVTLKGKVRDLNTSAYAIGDVLYASPLFTGQLTVAQPTPPDEVIVVAVVTAISATAGEVTVSVAPVINQLTTNITLYQTNVASDISTYFKMVNSQSDTDYNDTAVTIPVPSGSLGGSVGSTVVLSSFAAPANLFTGDPGVAVNITTSGNIMKTAGNNNTQTLFFFTVYKRSSSGTETLLGTSGQTGPAANVTHNQWQQFTEDVSVTLGTFLSTDRIVVKFHAYIAQAGTQAYAFQFGGLTPVRTRIPVPVSVISTSPAIGVSVDTTNFNNNLSSADNTVQLALETLDEIPINPIGIISPYAGATAPTGWLLCDGSAVSRTTYANLFTLIGTTYGAGNGSTTFNIPDMVGRVPVGRVASPPSLGSTTITIASPAVFTRSNHGLADGQLAYLTTTGALPTGLTANTRYFVRNATSTTFNLSTTLAGSLINTSGTQSGTHTLSDGSFADLGREAGAQSHTHTRGNLAAAIGATNSSTVTIGYQAGNTVAGGPTSSTYGISGTNQAGQSFNHYTPVYGSPDPSSNLSPYTVVNYIIKT